MQARLSDNLARVRERIETACAEAGRDPSEVTLVAVTKYAGPAYARALLELGQRDLGENRVAHLVELDDALAGHEPAPRWHMIGHLQRNKAAKVAQRLSALHSLDSAELAAKLSELRGEGAAPLEVYLQLRLDASEGRSGVRPEAAQELDALWDATQNAPGLRPLGLMGLPPMGEPEAARPHFRRVRSAAERLCAGGREARALSMGMTSDLEVAIQEGATIVRVGRALLEGLPDELVQA